MRRIKKTNKNVKTAVASSKERYRKPQIKKYPLMQQTTGYVVYYYVT